MLIRTPEQDIERVLFTEKAIAARVEQLGEGTIEGIGRRGRRGSPVEPESLEQASRVIHLFCGGQ